MSRSHISFKSPFKNFGPTVLFWIALLSLVIPHAAAARVNFTIDDTFGDSRDKTNHIIYDPQSAWKNGTSNSCTGCPDQDFAFGRTWHEGLFSGNRDRPPIATVTFYGTAVSVFCILDNGDVSAQTDLVFTLDRGLPEPFRPRPGGTTTVQYNVEVFKRDNLEQKNHTLTIQNGKSGGPRARVVLDYITYWLDDGIPDNTSGGAGTMAGKPSTPTSNSQASQASQIAGGIIGSLVGLAFVAIGIICYRRHSQQRPILPLALVQAVRNLKKNEKGAAPSRSQRGEDANSHRTSFHPSLFVRKFADKTSTAAASANVSLRRFASGRSAGPSRARPTMGQRPSNHAGMSTEMPYVSHDRRAPFHQTNPNASPGNTPLLQPINMPDLRPGSVLALAPPLQLSRIESIQAWQQQTQSALAGSPTPGAGLRRSAADMSEELSSYYDDNATQDENGRVKTPPPPRRPRTFTVMNN